MSRVDDSFIRSRNEPAFLLHSACVVALVDVIFPSVRVTQNRVRPLNQTHLAGEAAYDKTIFQCEASVDWPATFASFTIKGTEDLPRDFFR